MNNEIWRDIKDYEGLYQVSNLGRIKSLQKSILRNNGIMLNFKERILKPGLTNNGYLTVQLFKNKKGKTFHVHRLVAKAFILNSNDYNCINHKDENKQNNRVDNLEWCTIKYNNNYGNKNRSKRKKVNQYDLKGNFIKQWDSITDVEKKIKINHRNICSCCKSKRKSAGAYLWKYCEEYKHETY